MSKTPSERTVRLFVAFHVSNVASSNFSTTKKMRLCYRVAGYRFGCGSMCNYIVQGNGSQSRRDKRRKSSDLCVSCKGDRKKGIELRL